MSNERTRDRGNLFEYEQKQKPSQPDFHGDCTIDGTAYEIRGWRREDQLAVSLAPPRHDTNKLSREVFRGALDPAPAKPARASARGTNARGSQDSSKEPAVATPAWSGEIVSDTAAYAVRAFEKQGKSGMYCTLSFERIEKPAQDAPDDRWVDADADE
ncbi:MAG: hypothetical protein ABI467_29290 [Kofleriaceae bacterium]